MKKINEDFLHFLWKNQQLTGVTLMPVGDFSISILDPGIPNPNSGPDFFNSKIRLNNTIWAGNIELHINTSDWLKHGHKNDKLYDSVILHVVYFNDCEIRRKNGELIPAVILRFPVLLWDRFSYLKNNNEWIPCQNKLKELEKLIIVQWSSKLMVSRLEEKTDFLKKHHENLNGQWDAILCASLLRSFGIPVNTLPFEMLSLLIPYHILLRNKHDPYLLESILFGQAGFFDTSVPNDKYTEGLKQNYQRFSGSLDEKHVPLYLWKLMRMRPSSFPAVRIAQFAELIHQHFPLHIKLLSCPSTQDLKKIFRIKANDYWNTHYQLGKESPEQIKQTGKQFTQTIMINSIVPYMFLYGKTTGKNHFCDYAMNILEELPGENNVILKNWTKFGIQCSNAFDSQALLYLYKNYCKQKRCLECQFGNSLIINETLQE